MNAITIGLILPQTMGAYGDRGNATVLLNRLQKRGYKAQVVTVNVGEEIPSSLDYYLLGGSEDAAQMVAARELRESKGFRDAVQSGAVVLAVCAGMQVLGEYFEDASGSRVEGAGLLDVRTRKAGRRHVGELVTTARIVGLDQPLTGFENHEGVTTLGKSAEPLGKVLRGNGNADANTDGFDGAIQESIFATYMHGPVLARNPQLADHLIKLVTKEENLAVIDSPVTDLLREQRLEASGVSVTQP